MIATVTRANYEIKGILIDQEEIKVPQYANPTF